MADSKVCNFDRKRRNVLINLVPSLYVSVAPLTLMPSTFAAEGSRAQQGKDVESEIKASRQQKRDSLPLVLPESIAELSQLRMQPSKWMVSEKLDGVRAYWSGSELYFRSGRQINVPPWFIKDFPPFELDGELWLERGQFEKLSAAVRRQQADDTEWKEIKYYLFELPRGKGDFRARYTQLRDYTNRANIPWLKTIEQRVFLSRSDIQTYFDRLIRMKAEGIVMHATHSNFEEGRSKNLIKFKPYFDAEAIVLEHIQGNGKLSGKMGALIVENRDGIRFKLGTGFDDGLRRRPPGLGTWLTYRYRDLTAAGVPRFATYMRTYEAD